MTPHLTEIRGMLSPRMPAGTLSVSTINGDLRVLRKALKFADRCGLIRYRGVQTLPGEKNRIFVVSAELEEEYLAAATYPLREVAILILDLGLRPEEAVALRKDDVSEFGVTVPKGKTPNARRVLPQTERTREVFKLCAAVHPDSEWVFPGRKKGSHLTSNRVSMAHIELRDRAKNGAGTPRKGVVVEEMAAAAHFPREFLLYSLRHTFATRLAESGAGPWEICQLMGHSSVKVSERYIHPSSEHLGLAMKRKEAYDRMIRGEEVVTAESATRTKETG